MASLIYNSCIDDMARGNLALADDRHGDHNQPLPPHC